MKSDAAGTLLLSPCQIVAWNLKRARRARGWTQDEAAKQLEPYLGYRLSRAAFSQAEHCVFGKLRRFDADEIVAFSRALDVPIASLLVPPPQPFLGQRVVVNGKSGNPKARITSPPLSRQQMLTLAQRSPDAPSKPVRRGRPAYNPPPLEEVEAAAEQASDMAEIARFLNIHPATFYRKKRDCLEFYRAVERGRKKHASKRVRHRGTAPLVTATTEAVGVDAKMERLKTPAAPGSSATPATMGQKPPAGARESMGINSTVTQTSVLPPQNGITGDPAASSDSWPCPKCGRHVTLNHDPIWKNGIMDSHQGCPYLGRTGPT